MGDREEQYVTVQRFESFADKVGTDLKAVSSDIRAVAATLENKLDTKTSPNWTALGVGVTVIGMLIACQFYYFNTRLALAESATKEYNMQMNVRVERVENKLDDADREFRTRYLNMLESNGAIIQKP